MKNLMETMKWTVNQTLKAMNIPESDVERVRHKKFQMHGVPDTGNFMQA